MKKSHDIQYTVYTCAPIERVFSHGGNILKPDRSRLKPKYFEQLLFLNRNNPDVLVLGLQ